MQIIIIFYAVYQSEFVAYVCIIYLLHGHLVYSVYEPAPRRFEREHVIKHDTDGADGCCKFGAIQLENIVIEVRMREIVFGIVSPTTHIIKLLESIQCEWEQHRYIIKIYHSSFLLGCMVCIDHHLFLFRV